MRFATRALTAGILLALSLSTAPAAMAQAPVPLPSVEKFFGSSPFGGATLSPNGTFLAVRSGAPDKHDFLVVIDLAANKGTVVAAYDDADVADFRWISDERLVFTVRDKKVAPGDMRHGPGLFAVNKDGSTLVQLADRYHESVGGVSAVGRKLLPWHTFMLEQRGAQDSEYIYVASPVWDTAGKHRYSNLLRLNTITGQTQSVPRPGEVKGWMLDNKGEPRLASGVEKDTGTFYYRDPGTDKWRVLYTYKLFSKGRDDVTPEGFGADGSLYVSARLNGADTSSLHKMDVMTGKIDPTPLVSTPGYDFKGSLITNKDRLLGVLVTTDATGQEWVDPQMKALQQEVDKLLPATINLLGGARRSESPWIAVTGYSDAIPPTYWLYNKETKAISKVGESRPGIDPKQMGRQQFIRYKARDGLEIPALLTLPPGAKKTGLPMVVLVHGGPWVPSNTYGWHPQSQFLASRGYAVLEPAFRGTLGFGANHFLSSWKQWGLAMQNDVADGTRYLIGKGIADPKRICIAGASYGGYATLMGLVNDPDLYKCGINWVGVTDINLMYKGSWNYESDMSEEWKRYGMPEMIGDPVKDAQQLKATSPIVQAARITQPLILAYGGVDVRVPIYHGKQFYDAVTKTNKNVEWIEYPEEAHGWSLPKNNYDFWTRVEKFLDKNIGSGAQKQ